jgi:hypothetical protein
MAGQGESSSASTPDPRKSSRYGETDSNLQHGILECSQSPYYSQVLMVAKPNGSRRMCSDFRNLNECTEDASIQFHMSNRCLLELELENPNYLERWILLKDIIKLR